MVKIKGDLAQISIGEIFVILFLCVLTLKDGSGTLVCHAWPALIVLAKNRLAGYSDFY